MMQPTILREIEREIELRKKNLAGNVKRCFCFTLLTFPRNSSFDFFKNVSKLTLLDFSCNS